MKKLIILMVGVLSVISSMHSFALTSSCFVGGGYSPYYRHYSTYSPSDYFYSGHHAIQTDTYSPVIYPNSVFFSEAMLNGGGDRAYTGYIDEYFANWTWQGYSATGYWDGGSFYPVSSIMECPSGGGSFNYLEVTTSFSVSPTTADVGEYVSVTWSGTNADYCVAASQQWQSSGQLSVLVLPDLNGQHVMTCYTDYDFDDDDITLAVNSCTSPIPQIIEEYASYSVSLSPVCDDFTQSRSSTYFSFNEILDGSYSWALIRDPLVTSAASGYGLDKWRQEYGSALNMNSGYRSPAYNQSIGGAGQSRHMYGDAGDIDVVSNQEAEWILIRDAALDADPDFVEPSTGPCGFGCVHADWRSHSGDYHP